MKIYYMNGAGNDFMVMDGRGLKPDYSALAKKLCAITGADGFMAVDHSENADFKLHFYNSDGSRGEMCGNGSRCICRFANELGIAGEQMAVETDAGLVYGWHLEGDRYRVRLNTPTTVDLRRKGDIAYVELGNPGVPHAVTEVPDLSWDQKEALLPRALQLRHHPAFPKGANVNFYTWIAPDRLRVLTYERGVEGYTLACGTGCGSISSVLFAAGKLPSGKITLENEGGTLKFQVSGTGSQITSLLMEGPTEVLQVYEI